MPNVMYWHDSMAIIIMNYLFSSFIEIFYYDECP